MPNFPKEITNAQHPKDQIIYEKEDTVNRNDALVSNDRMIRCLVNVMRLQKCRNSRTIYTNGMPVLHRESDQEPLINKGNPDP